MFGVKIKTFCFKSDLLGNARDTFPTDDPHLWTTEISFEFNSDYVQHEVYVYIYI